MKSGIEMIQELLDKVIILDRRMEVIEQNMKLLLSNKNKNDITLIKPNVGPRLEASVPSTAVVKTNIENKQKKPSVKAAPNSNIIGKIQKKDGKGMEKVTVTIFDEKNNKIKETRTNKAGEWISFLPSGRYVAECIKTNEINENVIFNVSLGDKIVRVPSIKGR